MVSGLPPVIFTPVESAFVSSTREYFGSSVRVVAVADVTIALRLLLVVPEMEIACPAAKPSVTHEPLERVIVSLAEP